MARTSFLQDILSSLFEKGAYRALVEDRRPIEELCTALVSERGEISGSRIAAAILERYERLDRDGRKAFFELLVDNYDIDTEALAAAVEKYASSYDPEVLGRVLKESEPPRQELLRRLNQIPGATGRLVRMRADLLPMLREEPGLKRLDLDFRHLFVSWFNRGFLVLRPINWESPAHILEKIIAYEAVHAIDSWDDLRRRLQPSDRRCFAFFHPAMPDEPLIFVEVALTKGVPNSVDELLSEDREVLPQTEADTAAFYSISNCQVGLAGISFGNSLIKQVVADLSLELPNLKTFVTLSPIPGLQRWLKQQGFNAPKPEELEALAAHYLLNAKASNGAPYDPVARFHLGNGAMVHAIHANADSSDKGQAQSGGVMVNYLYDLSKIVRNHERFAADYMITATPAIRALAKDLDLSKPE